MYGLVNRAIEQLVRNQFGEEAWYKILERAASEHQMFVSMQAYPDELTYRLVGAASEVLGVDADSLLRAFGRHWITYTAKEGYGGLLQMAGNNLREFLRSLPQLHARVLVRFRHLRPPVFHVVEESGGQVVFVRYESTRAGLSPMMLGLLEGLAERFAETVEITQVERRAEHGHDLFRLSFPTAG
ncbi:MAG TPA: heme NO-binding domain-containing protein [Polyangia bacterium]|nr:heme NO-binding domain-containing protein [Polyangia bacterium]